MPAAAVQTSQTGHGAPPLSPGPGSADVQIGFLPAWRALPAGMASAVEDASNAVKSFLSKPQMTPADSAADLAQMMAKLGVMGGQAAANGSPAAASASATALATLGSTAVTLAATWTTASAVPGGMAPATTAFTKGIQAAAAASASAIFAAAAGCADQHICSMPSPAGAPHGPGFVTRGSKSVFINNLPAARQNDKVFEASGGEDPIAMGVQTVIIGDDGGGPAEGGAATVDPQQVAEQQQAGSIARALTDAAAAGQALVEICPQCAAMGAAAGTPTPMPQEVRGTPTPIDAGMNSIVCRAGRLVVQNNNTGPDRQCTQAHEESHIADWEGRYGQNLCQGVPDGQLPVGGDGYAEFLRQSECRAYRVGKTCRERLLRSAAEADKPAIRNAITRDDQQLRANRCS